MNRTLPQFPFMSREAELDRILARLRGSEPAAFVLAGPAGVGKTRLAAEAARSAAGLGYSTASVTASRAAATIPFGPFAAFLPRAGQASGDLLGLLHQAGEAILRQGGDDRRLVLVVDDAQLLDDGSAALVHQLVQQRSCSALASLRTPGSAPDPVTALWKDGLAERIDLDAWSEAETERVLGAVLGGPVAAVAVRRLWEVSRGNALYLRELVAGALASGALAKDGGLWMLRQPLTAPGRLVELVAARLDGLAEETIAVIELLAVGEPLGMPVLEKLSSPDGVEDAETQGFVRIELDGRRTQARLAHPIYGEALRQSLPKSRARRISAALADAVELTGVRRREDLLRIGRWRLDAGVAAESTLLSRAARRAREVFDNELAGRLARAALDAGGGAEAGLVLGEALFQSGRHAEAESVLADIAGSCETDDERANIASARAHNLSNLMGDAPAAMAVLDEALATVSEPDARLRLSGRLATIQVYEDDPHKALATAAPLLASADDAVVSRGAYVTSLAHAFLGHTQDAVAVAAIGLRSHQRALGLHQLPEAQLLGSALGHAAGGRLTLAAADAAAGYQASLAAGDREGLASHQYIAGRVLIEQGQLARAVHELTDAAAVNRDINDVTALRWCLAGIAMAEAMSGHADRASAAAAELDTLPGGALPVFEPDMIERSRAWVCVAAGELSAARELFAAAAGHAAAISLRVAEATLLHDLARLGQPDQVAQRLAELADQVDGVLVPTFARHAAVLASRADPAGLEAVAGDFEAMGALLYAAEAYQAAADGFQAHGLARRTSAAARKADELVAACAGARTPALRTAWRAGHSAGQLTPREREVAVMAAAGASSRAIAERLVLSVRTVDNHLQSAYGKLGVTSRDELAEILSR